MKPLKPSFEAEFVWKVIHDRYFLEDVLPKSLSLQCPHCDVYALMTFEAKVEPGGGRFYFICSCPNCKEIVFVTASAGENDVCSDHPSEYQQVDSIFPNKDKDVQIPPEVPERYHKDFREAVLTLGISPSASAALSRRLLQNIIRGEYGIQEISLWQELKTFKEKKKPPSLLAESIDAIREIGNFAAHPTKDTNTGEIVHVEPDEAEWLIKILKDLFDFAFVQPEKYRIRREELTKKLDSLEKQRRK